MFAFMTKRLAMGWLAAIIMVATGIFPIAKLFESMVRSPERWALCQVLELFGPLLAVILVGPLIAEFYRGQKRSKLLLSVGLAFGAGPFLWWYYGISSAQAMHGLLQIALLILGGSYLVVFVIYRKSGAQEKAQPDAGANSR
jgi:hypothetical protein